MNLFEIILVLAPAVVLGLHRSKSRKDTRIIASALVITGLCILYYLGPTLENSLSVLTIMGAAFLAGRAIASFRKGPDHGDLDWRYCPICSSNLELRAVDGSRRLACTSCDFVHWNNPITVGVMVVPSGDGIILVKRGNPPQKGMWALPGGFGDPHECPNKTAVREALEEIGLEVEIDRLLGVMGTPDCNQTLVFYLAKPVNQDPTAGSDALDARVFPLNALPEIAFDTHAQIIRDWVEKRDKKCS